jgi:predicted DNA-binding transcriptional regulator AlpA
MAANSAKPLPQPTPPGVTLNVDTDALARALVTPLAEAITERFRCEIAAGDDLLLTPAEASKMLARSNKTLEFWRSIGIGPRTVRLGARALAYRLGDLRAYIAEAATARGPARISDLEASAPETCVSE